MNISSPEIGEILHVPLLLEQLPPPLPDVSRDGPWAGRLHRIGSEAAAEQIFGLLPQVFVYGEDEEGDQSEVDVAEPQEGDVQLAQRVLSDLTIDIRSSRIMLM